MHYCNWCGCNGVGAPLVLPIEKEKVTIGVGAPLVNDTRPRAWYATPELHEIDNEKKLCVYCDYIQNHVEFSYLMLVDSEVNVTNKSLVRPMV